MEDKHLTTQESLDLISRMIANTRRNFNEKGGAMFLIWGYTTIAVTAAVTAAFMLTGNNNTMWLWWALPVIGCLLTWMHRRKHTKNIRTHLDKTVGYVWTVFAVAIVSCTLFSFITGGFAGKQLINIPFTCSLMIGMMTALTGLIIKFKPVAIGGFAGMACSLILPFFNHTIWQLPIFAAIFLIAQIIPGHMLNHACKKEAAERR